MSEWLDPNVVTSWLEQDKLVDFLVLPRRIAAALVAEDRPKTKIIADIGSGPGDFLEIMLDVFPSASGVWSDVSPTMADAARERLGRFGDRVEYVFADMTELSDLPGSLDVVVTSRATHHLDAVGLAKFYGEVAEHLVPGGWLVNLDHIGPGKVWDDRLRAVRKKLIPPSDKATAHTHSAELPSVSDHEAGLASAGFTDTQIAWRGLYTCLFVGRRDD